MEPINLGHIMFDGLKPLKNFVTDGEIRVKSSFYIVLGSETNQFFEGDPKIGVPKVSTTKGCSIVNYPFWGTLILGNHPFWGGTT